MRPRPEDLNSLGARGTPCLGLCRKESTHITKEELDAICLSVEDGGDMRAVVAALQNSLLERNAYGHMPTFHDPVTEDVQAKLRQKYELLRGAWSPKGAFDLSLSLSVVARKLFQMTGASHDDTYCSAACSTACCRQFRELTSRINKIGYEKMMAENAFESAIERNEKLKVGRVACCSLACLSSLHGQASWAALWCTISLVYHLSGGDVTAHMPMVPSSSPILNRKMHSLEAGSLCCFSWLHAGQAEESPGCKVLKV